MKLEVRSHEVRSRKLEVLKLEVRNDEARSPSGYSMVFSEPFIHLTFIFQPFIIISKVANYK